MTWTHHDTLSTKQVKTSLQKIHLLVCPAKIALNRTVSTINLRNRLISLLWSALNGIAYVVWLCQPEINFNFSNISLASTELIKMICTLENHSTTYQPTFNICFVCLNRINSELCLPKDCTCKGCQNISE